MRLRRFCAACILTNLAAGIYPYPALSPGWDESKEPVFAMLLPKSSNEKQLTDQWGLTDTLRHIL